MKSWHLAAALGLFSAQIIQSQVIPGPVRLPMSLLKLENKPQTHRDQHQDLNKAAGKKAMYERAYVKRFSFCSRMEVKHRSFQSTNELLLKGQIV